MLTPKTASGWLRQLPTLDVIGRQQHVMRAFEAMRQARRGPDPNRVAAVEFLDAALGADRRQLIKQYVENVDTSAQASPSASGRRSRRCRKASSSRTRASLEQALAQSDNPRWKPMTPLLFSRLIHYYGTDAKLRVFRYERWIPGKWMDLHQLYMRATELGVERVLVALGSGGANATQWTIEQEYVFVLLVHQLNTGNLSPAELDWATAQLRAWSRKLQLDAVPRSPEGFFVDVAGKGGLVRRTGNDSGSMLRYLDTTPLAEQLERAIRRCARPRQRIRVPRRRSISSASPYSRRCGPRFRRTSTRTCGAIRGSPCASPRRCASGLARICRDLASKDSNGARQRLERLRRADRGLRGLRWSRARSSAPRQTSRTRWPRRSRRSPIRCGR